jgi:DinB superfamily/Pentapeptide repeats (8 copies)
MTTQDPGDPRHHEHTDAFRGATFRRVDLSGASLREVDLSGATIRDSDVTGLRIVASVVDDVHLSGHEGVGRVVVDDVDVSAYVRDELDRRHPERVLVRGMRSADDLRAAWAVVNGRWDDAVAHAATVPEPLLHERVGGEWSFVETVRHLVFADDVWVGRMLSDQPGPFHPLGVPPTDTTEAAAAEMGLTLDARPSSDEVVALHRERRGRFTDLLLRVTDADLPRVRTAVLAPDWGEESFPVLECLTVVVREHADHLRFAQRDLATLEERSAPA